MPKYDALGYYAVLEVSHTAAPDVIKRQYYKCAKFWHPDRNKQANAQDVFQQVASAYGVLQNFHSRMIYDILSAIYTAKDFPPIGSLKIYKNQKDVEDKALRVLKQYHVSRGKITESKDVCNIAEAADLTLAASVSNWLKGWWGKNGFAQTVKALKFNYDAASALDSDNVKLLVHNALAYEQENNPEMAWIYAKQAQKMLEENFSNQHLQNLLQQFLAYLDYTPTKIISVPYWNTKHLRCRQLYFPLGMLTVMFVALAVLLLRSGLLLNSTASQKTYYEERRFADGSSMASDTVATKILKIDSSPYNSKDLAYLRRNCTVYHGPDERFAVMLEARYRQTVRISGYTADKSWYQIIVDNGEIGYISANCLKIGMGNPVPAGSKVYKGY